MVEPSVAWLAGQLVFVSVEQSVENWVAEMVWKLVVSRAERMAVLKDE
jgi:hypothetical protein